MSITQVTEIAAVEFTQVSLMCAMKQQQQLPSWLHTVLSMCQMEANIYAEC